MIRNAMLGLSLIAFTAGSAFAGNVKHAAKTPVAAAPAGDAAKTDEKAGHRGPRQEREEGRRRRPPRPRRPRARPR